jgi:hypothetical protein
MGDELGKLRSRLDAVAKRGLCLGRLGNPRTTQRHLLNKSRSPITVVGPPPAIPRNPQHPVGLHSLAAMPRVTTTGAVTAMAVDDENEENIPPGRRSQRTKRPKSASAAETGAPCVCARADVRVDPDEMADEDDDEEQEEEEEDEDEEEQVEKRRKRARKMPPAATGRRRSSGAKTNGVAKGGKGKGGRKVRKSDGEVELTETTTECPMLG